MKKKKVGKTKANYHAKWAIRLLPLNLHRNSFAFLLFCFFYRSFLLFVAVISFVFDHVRLFGVSTSCGVVRRSHRPRARERECARCLFVMFSFFFILLRFAVRLALKYIALHVLSSCWWCLCECARFTYRVKLRRKKTVLRACSALWVCNMHRMLEIKCKQNHCNYYSL